MKDFISGFKDTFFDSLLWGFILSVGFIALVEFITP